MRFSKLTLFQQLAIVLFPVVVLVVAINSYRFYNESSQRIVEREKEKIENITNGITQFIENHDLSLDVVEYDLESKIASIYDSINRLQIDSWRTINLDKLKNSLGMDSLNENLYLIDTSGIIVNTTKKSDLDLNISAMGDSYVIFFDSVRTEKRLFIERVILENRTKIPMKYAYQAVDDNYILEYGLHLNTFDSLISDFNSKIHDLTSRYEIIESIDLFGATEAFPSRNPDSKISEDLKLLALKAAAENRDTVITKVTNQGIRKTHLVPLPIRNSSYYKGYILQIVSNDSKERQALAVELRHFFIKLFLTLLIVVLVLFFIVKKLTTPLTKLTRKLQYFGISDQNYRAIEGKGSKETSQLIEKFNEMILRISDSQKLLEIKVEQRTEQLAEKNRENVLLVKEIHHRVKNNLQIVSSLLNLQVDKISDPESQAVLMECRNRISSMAALHEKLYANGQFNEINASVLIVELIDHFKRSLPVGISFTHSCDESIILNSTQSIALGLILNEAILNAVKHGKKDVGLSVTIELKRHNNKLLLSIRNDGNLLEEGFDEIEEQSLGLMVIDSFVDKIQGTFSLKNEQKQVELSVQFPELIIQSEPI